MLQSPDLYFGAQEPPERVGPLGHLLARTPRADLFLPRSALIHLCSQHGFDSGVGAGSRFGEALALPIDDLGVALLSIVAAQFSSRQERQAGACFQFNLPGPPIGVDAAVFGRAPDFYALKEQGGKGVLVPAVCGAPAPTNALSAIMSPSELSHLPADAANCAPLLSSIASGRLLTVWSIFPGACILPGGSPFPRSSEMIGSGVCLVGAGHACSEAEAVAANKIMDSMASPPSADALIEILRSCAQRPAGEKNPTHLDGHDMPNQPLDTAGLANMRIDLDKLLIDSAISGNLTVINDLLAKGVDPRLHFSNALAQAAAKGHIECVKALLPLSDPTANHCDAAVGAAVSGHPECLRLLLPLCYGAVVDALVWSAQNGHSECVKILLEFCDPDSKTKAEALSLAAEHGRLECLLLLLPASPSLANDSEPLRLASKHGASDCVRALLPVSPSIFEDDRPLRAAVNHGQAHVLSAMLDHHPLLEASLDLPAMREDAVERGFRELAELAGVLADRQELALCASKQDSAPSNAFRL